MAPTKNYKYEERLIWDGESGGRVEVGKSMELRLDMPVEFGGRGRYPCPDELFLAGSAGCLLTTFLYFRKKLNLQMKHFEVLTSGKLSSGPDGYRIARIEYRMNIKTNSSERTKARRCVELTKRYCHLTRILEKIIPIKITAGIEC
ncbi:MAG: OsmC family protein [Candidatus Bathyarchaeia archaeon]